MLATNNFVFLHVPKTGGRFIRNVINKYCEDVVNLGGVHKGVNDIPVGYKELPIVCFIRKPETWYASWIQHMMPHGAGNKDIIDGLSVGITDNIEILRFILNKNNEGVYTRLLKGMGLLNNKNVLFFEFEKLVDNVVLLLEKYGYTVNREDIYNMEKIGESSKLELPSDIIDMIRIVDKSLHSTH